MSSLFQGILWEMRDFTMEFRRRAEVTGAWEIPAKLRGCKGHVGYRPVDMSRLMVSCIGDFAGHFRGGLAGTFQFSF
jgi:hypothetical protein